jgi:hypothetical protein
MIEFYWNKTILIRRIKVMGIKKKIISLVCGLFAFTLVGCVTHNASTGTDLAQLKTPTKSIVVTAGDISQPYKILGEVDGTLTGQPLSKNENNKEVNDMLRMVAFTQFGEAVDAVVNTETSVEMGRFAGMAAVYGASTVTYTAHGIAVQFKK